jgi:hypothetical protein
MCLSHRCIQYMKHLLLLFLHLLFFLISYCISSLLESRHC